MSIYGLPSDQNRSNPIMPSMAPICTRPGNVSQKIEQLLSRVQTLQDIQEQAFAAYSRVTMSVPSNVKDQALQSANVSDLANVLTTIDQKLERMCIEMEQFIARCDL